MREAMPSSPASILSAHSNRSTWAISTSSCSPAEKSSALELREHFLSLSEEIEGMAAYLLGQIIIHDMEKFMPYVANTTAAIAKYGGEVLDVVEAKEVMEGNWPVGARTALVRFPDEASLRKFWNSPENASMKELRHGTATSHVALCMSVPYDNPPK
jgi:uncharacterized protein (DUF1330 family)